MMEFPRFVFKDGGPNVRAGGTYDHCLVEDESEYDAAIAAGWFGGMVEAIEAPKVERVVVSDPKPTDDEPPTRKELEAKANELGIKFDGRLGDKKLAALIAKELGV